MIRRETLREGMRVALVRDVERFPHFVAPAGAAGMVVAVGDEFAVKMDKPIPGAETWDNEILWIDGQDPSEDLRRSTHLSEFTSSDDGGSTFYPYAAGALSEALRQILDSTGEEREERIGRSRDLLADYHAIVGTSPLLDEMFGPATTEDPEAAAMLGLRLVEAGERRTRGGASDGA